MERQINIHTPYFDVHFLPRCRTLDEESFQLSTINNFHVIDGQHDVMFLNARRLGRFGDIFTATRNFVPSLTNVR